MYVLELEMPGDYGDFYQRPSEIIAVSEDKTKLKEIWNNIPISIDRTYEGCLLRIYNGEFYIDYNIHEVDVV